MKVEKYCHWLRCRPLSAARKAPRTDNRQERLRLILVEPLKKFDPRVQIKNPVMFVVWIGTLVTAALTINPQLFGPSNATSLYNGVVTFILFITVWFANLAEAMAEGRGKAKAASLRQTTTQLNATRLLADGRLEVVSAAALRKDDLIKVEPRRTDSHGRRSGGRRRLCRRVDDHR